MKLINEKSYTLTRTHDVSIRYFGRYCIFKIYLFCVIVYIMECVIHHFSYHKLIQQSINSAIWINRERHLRNNTIWKGKKWKIEKLKTKIYTYNVWAYLSFNHCAINREREKHFILTRTQINHKEHTTSNHNKHYVIQFQKRFPHWIPIFNTLQFIHFTTFSPPHYATIIVVASILSH